VPCGSSAVICLCRKDGQEIIITCEMRIEGKEHRYSCSSELMNAVRALDYKAQYKVCYAFYDAIIKYPRWDNNRFCLLFDEIYEAIDPDILDEEILRIRQCVNEMDNVLSEMDEREPGTFCEKAGELTMFIEGKCPEED